MADAAKPQEKAPDKAKPKRGAGGLLLAVGAFIGGAAAGGAGAAMALTAFAPHTAAPAKGAPAAPSPLEYVEIDNAFTSNLTDTGRYLQLRIAVSTTGGAPVVAALQTHKLAIVSAVLAVMGDLGEGDIADSGAKTKLKGQLREAIDGVLKQKAGGGSIDEVFLTSLVVQ
ncbi:flagellar basal body-associated FliL family protein [Glacieibacterium frigidum]|uniref:Flagellar protein FliL n=1 Tax=Glacieibacterium frigidum TaxID=2593303 RepID=A0A552U797_9SPHN|nr:flagellar basal body-associated FliL family protein [Glacieibacterium frigidum]TRW14093.1 flagellar basal body-associated FliL family protein [Glacieibacterium frigidum]